MRHIRDKPSAGENHLHDEQHRTDTTDKEGTTQCIDSVAWRGNDVVNLDGLASDGTIRVACSGTGYCGCDGSCPHQ